jgi:small subunit ribosomal protein S4
LATEARTEKESRLLKSLNRLGLVNESASLDDVLNLKIEDLLERRLQTIVMKKAGTKSPHMARQVVVHGHVSIGDRIVNLPGYIVKKEEEDLIRLRVNMLTGSSITQIPKE